MCKKTSSKSLISGKRSEVEFSICIPTYKRTQYLKQAIDSVLMQDDIEKYLGISTLAVVPDRKDYIGSKKKKHKKKRKNGKGGRG